MVSFFAPRPCYYYCVFAIHSAYDIHVGRLYIDEELLCHHPPLLHCFALNKPNEGLIPARGFYLPLLMSEWAAISRDAPVTQWMVRLMDGLKGWTDEWVVDGQCIYWSRQGMNE